MEKAASSSGIMTALRRQAARVARMLVIALALQLAGPFPGMFPQKNHAGDAAGMMAVCSESGLVYLPFDGTQGSGKNQPSKTPTDDCCRFGCPMHGLVLPALPPSPIPAVGWNLQIDRPEPTRRPQAHIASPFEARAPPFLT